MFETIIDFVGKTTSFLNFKTGFYDEFKERIKKEAQYGHNEEFDKIRWVFAHSGYSEDQIIEYLERENIDVNQITSSFVVGVYQPIFFWSYNKPKVLNHLIEKKKIDTNRTMELRKRNPYYQDFLDRCPEQFIPKLKTYGFQLTKKDICRKYFNIYNVNRLLKFTEVGLLEFEELKKCTTEENLKYNIKSTHQTIFINLEKEGNPHVLEENLLSILKIYERFDRFKKIDAKNIKTNRPATFGDLSNGT